MLLLGDLNKMSLGGVVGGSVMGYVLYRGYNSLNSEMNKKFKGGYCMAKKKTAKKRKRKSK